MNDQVAAGLTNGSGMTLITPGSDPMAGLQQAAANWNGLPDSMLRTRIAGTTPSGFDFQDGENVILFANSPESRSFVGGALAVAVPVSFDDGIIVDSDIIFSDVGTRPFSTDIVDDTFHLQSVGSHDIGHTQGLGHAGVAGTTMFARIGDGTDIQQTPKEDDLTFVRDNYGVADVAARFGSIQGTVSIDGGGTANGVFVAAVNSSSGAVISTLTDFTNGTFDMGPIPPGNYFVSAEPVDGPAITSDYPGVTGFDLNISDGFFGGNANLPAVNVTAGKGASNVSFSVQLGPPTLEIRRLGIGPEDGSPFRHSTAPRLLAPGDARRIYIWGPGIDDSIGDANVRIFGDAVTIRPGSVGVVPGFGSLNDGTHQGMFVGMTVDAAASVQGIPLATIAVFKDGQAGVFTGGLVVQGADDGPQNPEFTSAGLAHSARLEAGDVAEQEIVSQFGLLMSDFDADATLPLGFQLGGSSADVTDSQGVTRPCLMFAARSNQLNFMIAAGTAEGPATLTIRRASGGSHSISINVVKVAPGVFTANASGSGFPAANILRFIDGV